MRGVLVLIGALGCTTTAAVPTVDSSAPSDSSSPADTPPSPDVPAPQADAADTPAVPDTAVLPGCSVAAEAWPGGAQLVSFTQDAQEPQSAAWPSNVALVVAPLADGDSSREAALETLNALPADSRVALWRVGAEAELLADLGDPRERVLQRLLEAPLPAADSATLEALDARGDARLPVSVVVIRGGETPTVPTLVREAWCAGDPLSLETCRLEAPPVLPGNCDASAIAADDWAYPERLDFEFTAEQRAIHDAAAAAKSDEDFEVTVRVEPYGAVTGVAHLRGQSSLDCARKSYTVNLDREVRLMPGAVSDRFYLISLCLDSGYFRLELSNRLMSQLGLYPLDRRFVRFSLDGEERGVYLLVEHVEHTLRDENVGVQTVIRRRFDPEDFPVEIDYVAPPLTEDDARARYDALAGAIAGDTATLDARLDALMDVDQYLRWLAFQSLFQNGDYVDEAFFWATGSDWRFRVLGWDSDDLFSSCHHGGKWALQDPAGLLFCAEGKLDAAVMASPALYARFVNQLEQLIEALPPEAITGHVASVRDALWEALDDDAAAAAMVELPDAPLSLDAARAVITKRMTDLEAAYAARRDLLTQRIAAWRQL